MPDGRVFLWTALVTVALGTAAGAAQDPPRPGKEKDAALKLPDGTIVFYSKSPDDANPPLEGVRLSVAEYKQLIEQVDQWKKNRDAVKPIGPSECHLTGRVVQRGDRSVVELTLRYLFRTTGPRTSVLLGGGRSFPTAAKIDGEFLPVLIATDDGLTAIVESPGDHSLTLQTESPVTARGFADLFGVDIGLPKAAITTLQFQSPYPPQASGRRITVAVKGADPTAKPGETQRTSYDAANLADRAIPIGPAEHVEVVWEATGSNAGTTPRALAVETDIVVRIEDTLVETTAKVKLRGDAAREWNLVLPEGAVVGTERSLPVKVSDPAAGLWPKVQKPLERDKPGQWTIALPDAAEWVLTAVIRSPRPSPDSPGYSGPYPVGPVVVPNVIRQSGTVRISCPSHVRLTCTHGSELRRIDPLGSEAAAFQFTTVPLGPGLTNPPLLSVTASPAPGVVFLKPHYRLRLTPSGLKVHADLRITPVRMGVAHVRIEYPADWPLADIGPSESAENMTVDPPGPMRGATIRFNAARHDPFDLTLDVTLPLAPGLRTVSTAFPEFPGVVARETLVSVMVPQGFEVRGSMRADTEAGPNITDLMRPVLDLASKSSTGTLTGSVAGSSPRVDLHWKPDRPPITADIHADVTLQERQVRVVETLAIRMPDAFGQSLRFRGPVGVVGLRGQPTLTPGGPGEWTVTPPVDRGKEWTLTLTYATPLRADGAAVPIGLIWPEDATQTEAVARVWSGTDRRLSGFSGPWRESSSTPSANKDTWPGLTVKSTRGPEDPAPPLAISLSDAESRPSRAVIERSLFQTWNSPEGTANRARYVLSRWSEAGLDIDLPATTFEVWIDGKRFDNVQPLPPVAGYEAAVRILLPDTRAARSTVTLDVRFAGRTSNFIQPLHTPAIRGATQKTPMKWQLVTPPGKVVLAPFDGWVSDTRWTWRNAHIFPAPVGSTVELDRWLTNGSDPTELSDEPGIVGRLFRGDGSTRIVLFPYAAWTALCSGLVLAIGLSAPRVFTGIGFRLLGIGVPAVVLTLLFPQPSGQFLAAAQPGLVALILVITGQSIVRGYYRRRLNLLPGFSRTPAVTEGYSAAIAGGRTATPLPKPNLS